MIMLVLLCEGFISLVYNGLQPHYLEAINTSILHCSMSTPYFINYKKLIVLTITYISGQTTFYITHNHKDNKVIKKKHDKTKQPLIDNFNNGHIKKKSNKSIPF